MNKFKKLSEEYIAGANELIKAMKLSAKELKKLMEYMPDGKKENKKLIEDMPVMAEEIHSFLTKSDSEVVNYRTGGQVLNDIGTMKMKTDSYISEFTEVEEKNDMRNL